MTLRLATVLITVAALLFPESSAFSWVGTRMRKKSGSGGTPCVAGSQTFTYTGSLQSLTVPAGCNHITVKAWGAGGGGAQQGGGYMVTANGGGAAFAKAYVPVTPGNSLKIVVGGGGMYGVASSCGGGAGGYGGGGNGAANSAICQFYGPAGGGGYSGVFDSSVSQANALVIAGGGGGGGSYDGVNGGGAGAVGTTAQSGSGGHPGAGGTPSSGGAGGTGGASAGGTGTALTGGNGAAGTYTGGGHGGGYGSGGGGGGYWGAGGGGEGNAGGGLGAGGGGGSSYVIPSGINLISTNPDLTTAASYGDPDWASGVGMGGQSDPTGVAGGNGRVLISWSPSPPFDLRFVANDQSTSSGTTRTFTAANFGAAQADRLIIAIVGWGLGGATDLQSATIGGVAATIAIQNDGSNVGQAIIYAAVPTGTSGDIALTWVGSVSRSSVAVYRLTGQQSNTPYATAGPAGGGDSSRAATFNIPTDGGSVIGSTSGLGNTIWGANAAEDVDTVAQAGQQWYSSSRATLYGTSQAIYSSNARVVTGASWR